MIRDQIASRRTERETPDSNVIDRWLERTQFEFEAALVAAEMGQVDHLEQKIDSALSALSSTNLSPIQKFAVRDRFYTILRHACQIRLAQITDKAKAVNAKNALDAQNARAMRDLMLTDAGQTVQSFHRAGATLRETNLWREQLQAIAAAEILIDEDQRSGSGKIIEFQSDKRHYPRWKTPQLRIDTEGGETFVTIDWSLSGVAVIANDDETWRRWKERAAVNVTVSCDAITKKFTERAAVVRFDPRGRNDRPCVALSFQRFGSALAGIHLELRAIGLHPSE